MPIIKQKDLVAEVWKSKLSYCEIVDQDFLHPTVVVASLSGVTDPDLTIRHDTHEHIPLVDGKPKGKGRLSHLAGQIMFEPFILYRSEIAPDGRLTFRETARSHWKGGSFNPDGGRLTHALAKMLIAIVEGYGRKGSWRNYSYVDEMKAEAVLNLAQHVLKFDAAKTPNAHAYVSRCAQTSFIRELRKQKRQSAIRDEIMVINGMTPSHAAQVAVQPKQTKPKT